MTKLKPCPFCGSENVVLTKGKACVDGYFARKYRNKLRAVVCRECGCNGGIFNTLALTDKQAEKKAVESWNRRADDD